MATETTSERPQRAQRRLHGIFTPHMVPLDAERRIQERELRRLVDFLIDRGIHGLYPNGSTGEFTRFTAEERREIVRIVTEQAAGRAIIMAGAAEPNVDTTLEVCAHYAKLGCDCVAIVPPYYFPLSQPSVREYYTVIARDAPIDLVLYNIPQFTNPISLDTLRQLVELPRIIGIKDSSRDLSHYLNMMNELRPVRPDFSFLIGCEELLVPSLIMGGDGGTVATSGVVPELMVELYKQVRLGDLQRAVALQYRLLSLIKQLIFGVSFPGGIRAALALRGFDMGPSRQPLAPEERADVDGIQRELRSLLGDLGCPLEPGAEPGVCAAPGAGALAEARIREVVERVLRRLQDTA